MVVVLQIAPISEAAPYSHKAYIYTMAIFPVSEPF